MTKLVSSFFIFVFLSFTSAAQAWTEVANEMIFADGMVNHRILFKDKAVQYQDVMLQVLSPQGARIYNAVVTTRESGQHFVSRLDGDYAYGIQKVDRFSRGNVRELSFFIASLQSGHPVRLRVMMR